MPSLQEQLEQARAEILSWHIDGVGSQTFMRHKKRSALEGIMLIQKLMTVDHLPDPDSIRDGDDMGTQMQTAICKICKTFIDRYEDVDRNQWETWRSLADGSRCFGLVKP